MDNQRLGIQGIGQIAVTVRDLDRAIAFYRDTLELPFLFQAPPAMAFFDCGGVRLMLTLPESADGDRYASILYYRVPDIRAAFETLSGRGVRFDGEPHVVAELEDHTLWMAFLRDPDANLLALMTEVARSADALAP